jgi:hypothetical protein
MAAAGPVDVAVNPNNTDQRYILWGNGRIDALGGAVPVTGQKTWYDRFEPPAVALHITNWTTGAGYMLEYRGGFEPFNGAPNLGAGPEYYTVAGIPRTASPYIRRYVDWSWDPAGTGQGYVLDQYGQLLQFGGATAPPRTGPMWTWPAAKKLVMRWTPSKLGIILDLYGGLHDEFGLTSFPGGFAPVAYAKGMDYARDIVVTDWAVPSGYTLNLYGGVYPFGSATSVAQGSSYRRGADVGRSLAVISASNPLALWEVWSGGQSFDFVHSSPPTVVAGSSNPQSPTASVTGTTRPVLSWSYSDPQLDTQAAWELYVYTTTWTAGHNMTDPSVWAANATVAEEGINPATRGIASPVDLANGNYVMYVRAQDTAGQWSTWSSLAWTQAVPLPTTPTGMSATANQTTYSVALSVSATTGQAANLVRFEYSDNAGVTWLPVRGADAVPLIATTTATDRDAPLGKARIYRARSYAVDPAVASVPSGTASATLTTLTYVLTATDDPTLGGKVRVQEPVEWVRPVTAGVFQGVGADFVTVVKDGQPKGKRVTLHVFSEDATAWAVLEGLAESESTLVYRDPFGEVRYCEIVGDWGATLMDGAATRNLRTTDLPLIEVVPPQAT